MRIVAKAAKTMNTIRDVLAEFLDEQGARLSPRTFRKYKDAVSHFEDYLDSYAYQYLDQEDTDRYQSEYVEEQTEFCDILPPNRISSTEISDFLDDYVIRKVVGSKEFLRTVGTVTRTLVEWMSRKGFLGQETVADCTSTIDRIEGDLPQVSQLSDLLYEYAEKTAFPAKNSIEGYFRVTNIKPGQLWLKDAVSGNELGPVIVSREISSRCRKNWVICLELAKKGRTWRIIETGFVYPR